MEIESERPRQRCGRAPAPRTLVQTGSYRTMPNLDPLHVVVDDLLRICQFSMVVNIR